MIIFSVRRKQTHSINCGIPGNAAGWCWGSSLSSVSSKDLSVRESSRHRAGFFYCSFYSPTAEELLYT